MENLIEQQKSILNKIRSIQRRPIHHGFCIDLDILDNVQVNKDGKPMTSQELLDMFFETGVFIGKGGMGITRIEGVSEFQLSLLYSELADVTEQILKINP